MLLAMFLLSSTFVNKTMGFNSFPGNRSRKKSIRVILLVTCDTGTTESPNIVFNQHWQNGTGFSFAPSASFFHFCLWYSTNRYHPLHLLPLLPNPQETSAMLVLSVVEMGIIIWHYANGDTTNSAAVDDKTMVTMSSTVVVDPVVVSQL